MEKKVDIFLIPVLKFLQGQKAISYHPIIEERNKRFAERRDVAVKAWKEMGLEMLTPRATFYCWGEIPQGHTSQEFSFRLLEERNVWMIPGSAYGEKGEGYVRIANAQPVERIAEAMERLKKFSP